MSDYDDIAHGSTMPNGSDEMPPADAEGLDRPSDNEDALDDTAQEFTDRQADGEVNRNDLDDDDDDIADDESLLSEVDEAQFEDFDPTAVQVAPDYEQLKSIKVQKRKRADGEDGLPKKKKERTREKTRRRDEASGGEAAAEPGARKSRRRAGEAGEGVERKRRERVEVDEDSMTPEERRRRALDRAMDAAVKKSNVKRMKKGEIDLDTMADEEIAEVRNRMIAAAEADGELVREGKPAFQKLKMLKEVVSLLNRNTLTQAILDPETNVLEAVRFFLEPLQDGSLPAFNIQRELFQALERLPMTKEALISSGIGKVIYFYRKSKRVDPKIKRQATKLMEEWSRPILQRSDDFTKKSWTVADFDPARRREDAPRARAPVARKANAPLAPGQRVSNRARALPGVTGYTIVPQMSQAMPRR